MKKCNLCIFLILLCGFSAVAENWTEVERFSTRSVVGPIHYRTVPAHYETKTENGESEKVFVDAEYKAILPIYNKETELTRYYIEESEIIYRRLNKRPSIEVAYDVVTYIGQESKKYKIEFENVEILIN